MSGLARRAIAWRHGYHAAVAGARALYERLGFEPLAIMDWLRSGTP